MAQGVPPPISQLPEDLLIRIALFSGAETARIGPCVSRAFHNAWMLSQRQAIQDCPEGSLVRGLATKCPEWEGPEDEPLDAAVRRLRALTKKIQKILLAIVES